MTMTFDPHQACRKISRRDRETFTCMDYGEIEAIESAGGLKLKKLFVKYFMPIRTMPVIGKESGNGLNVLAGQGFLKYWTCLLHTTI